MINYARLAEAADLQMQCKGARWNVKGPNFIALHKLLDQVIDGTRGSAFSANVALLQLE
jgi:DNA-binding ferritin-like protein